MRIYIGKLVDDTGEGSNGATEIQLRRGARPRLGASKQGLAEQGARTGASMETNGTTDSRAHDLRVSCEGAALVASLQQVTRASAGPGLCGRGSRYAPEGACCGGRDGRVDPHQAGQRHHRQRRREGVERGARRRELGVTLALSAPPIRSGVTSRKIHTAAPT